MRYFLFILLSFLSLAVVTPVSAATKIHAFDVPSPACVVVNPNQPCVQTVSPSAGANTVSPGAGGSKNGSSSAQPSIAQTISSAPSGNPSPSSAAPCSTSSSQSTGNVSALSRHHGKWHRSAGGGFLQQFIQLLWQLLQQLFKQLGISLPNITIPCGSGSGSNTSPSGTPGGSGGGNGNISGTPSGSGGQPGPSSTISQSPAASGSSSTTSSGFIGVSGSQLTLNGKPYKSVGYGFSAVGACWSSDWTTSQMDTFFSNLPKDSMARFFAPPNDVSASFVESVVKEADKYSIHLIIALADADVDNNCDTEDASNGGKTAAYYTNAVQAGSPYANWVKSVVTPLANDPGVAMWEIVNEPFHQGASFSQIGQTAAVNYVNAAATLIRNAETAGAGKPKQLITLGTVDIGETGGVNGMEAIFKNLDVVNDHDYSGDQGGSTQYVNGEFPQLQQVAQALGKPYMVDETGVEAGTSCSSSNVQGAWDNGSAGLTLAGRVNFLLTQKATSYLKSGASYVGFWLYTGSGGGCTYENIYPGDPIMAAVKSFVMP